MAEKLKGNGAAAKKRGRKKKDTPAPRVWTEAEKAEARQRAFAAHDDYLSSQGAMRNKAKAVTKAVEDLARMTGEDKKQIRWGLEARKCTPQDIDAETRARTRIAQFFGMPIGTQLGMFKDGASVATKVEAGNGAMSTPESLKKARLDGVQAGLDGKSREAGNPHKVVGSPEYLAWDNGWLEGQADLVKGFGAKATHTEPAHA